MSPSNPDQNMVGTLDKTRAAVVGKTSAAIGVVLKTRITSSADKIDDFYKRL